MVFHGSKKGLLDVLCCLSCGKWIVRQLCMVANSRLIRHLTSRHVIQKIPHTSGISNPSCNYRRAFLPVSRPTKPQKRRQPHCTATTTSNIVHPASSNYIPTKQLTNPRSQQTTPPSCVTSQSGTTQAAATRRGARWSCAKQARRTIVRSCRRMWSKRPRTPIPCVRIASMLCGRV